MCNKLTLMINAMLSSSVDENSDTHRELNKSTCHRLHNNHPGYKTLLEVDAATPRIRPSKIDHSRCSRDIKYISSKCVNEIDKTDLCHQTVEAWNADCPMKNWAIFFKCQHALSFLGYELLMYQNDNKWLIEKLYELNFKQLDALNKNALSTSENRPHPFDQEENRYPSSLSKPLVNRTVEIFSIGGHGVNITTLSKKPTSCESQLNQKIDEINGCRKEKTTLEANLNDCNQEIRNVTENIEERIIGLNANLTTCKHNLTQHVTLLNATKNEGIRLNETLTTQLQSCNTALTKANTTLSSSESQLKQKIDEVGECQEEQTILQANLTKCEKLINVCLFGR